MMHFKIVLTGSGILVDHYGSPEPIMGFIACRILKAESEEMAVALAKRNVLMQWNQSFNADRKAGLPKLSLERVMPIKPLFARKPRHDYYFYDCEEKRQEHLEYFTQGKKGWFRRKKKSSSGASQESPKD